MEHTVFKGEKCQTQNGLAMLAFFDFLNKPCHLTTFYNDFGTKFHHFQFKDNLLCMLVEPQHLDQHLPELELHTKVIKGS